MVLVLKIETSLPAISWFGTSFQVAGTGEERSRCVLKLTKSLAMLLLRASDLRFSMFSQSMKRMENVCALV